LALSCGLLGSDAVELCEPTDLLMRHFWTGLAVVYLSSPVYAAEPLWCVQSYETEKLFSLGYSYDTAGGGMACDDYMKPVFEIKQTAPNTCLFYWELNIASEVIPDISFDTNHMVGSTLKKRGRTDWHHTYCYQGVDDETHTFRSCKNPDFNVYSSWQMLEQYVVGFQSLAFYGDKIGNGLVFSHENFYQAFKLFREKTGCPAMF